MCIRDRKSFVPVKQKEQNCILPAIKPCAKYSPKRCVVQWSPAESNAYSTKKLAMSRIYLQNNKRIQRKLFGSNAAHKANLLKDSKLVSIQPNSDSENSDEPSKPEFHETPLVSKEKGEFTRRMGNLCMEVDTYLKKQKASAMASAVNVSNKIHTSRKIAMLNIKKALKQKRNNVVLIL
eukprot:TRINITY_DN21501_c0_g1_i1.p1 TRINITY_DN21501_c0_g1~~TRINITY_DN21501_c0_g1_i1.p1  ORF type:complete len:179 (-),score=41.65 TRINITY_DN21501_c0_g1_i1:299-835(-)